MESNVQSLTSNFQTGGNDENANFLLILVLIAVLCGTACRGREQPAAPIPTATVFVAPPAGQPPAARPSVTPFGGPPVQPQPAGQASPTPPTRPDLIIAETTVTPATANSSQVRIHIVARNQGGPISAAFTIRWHPHQKDQGLVGCSQDFYNLTQREWVVDCAYTYPAGERGEMHWVAVVDAENDVKSETNENNNEKTGTVLIGSSGGGATQPPAGQAPAAPTGCKATQIDTRTIRVEWQFTGQADGFRIYQGKTSLEATVNASARSWTIADLPGGVQHHFDVRAYNASGESRADACSVDVTRR